MAGLLLSFLMACLYIWQPLFLIFLNHKIYDSLLRSTHSPEVTNVPVIVDVDEKSLLRFGQWPWPRYRIARLLEKIKHLGAQAVAIDMVFAEPDRTSLGLLTREIKRDFKFDIEVKGFPAKFEDNDKILAHTIGQGPFVLGYKFLYTQDDLSGKDCTLHPLNVAYLKKSSQTDKQPPFFRAAGVVCNLGVLSRAAPSSGFFDAAPDIDGVLRRIPMLVEYQGKVFPSLALATLMQVQKTRQILIALSSEGIEALQIENTTIPLDYKGNLLIHYRGQRGRFDYISAGDVLNGSISKEHFKNKIVFLGTSAAGLKEIRATPLDPAFPGVEIHATVVDNILKRDFVSRPPFANGMELLLVVLLGICATFLLTWSKSLLSVIILGIASISIYSASHAMLRTYGFFLSPVLPLLTVAVHFSTLTLLKFWHEEKQTRMRTRELALTQDVSVRSLAALAETRDPETGGHILRTQRYVRALALRLKNHPKFKDDLGDGVIEILYKMAPLHDIGKVGVRDHILLKPARLSLEEFEQMKLHTDFGRRALQVAEKELGRNSFLQVAIEIAYSHQEKWDGSGYPLGLKETDIPISARLMAVADVYDALISKRVYKNPIPHYQAVQWMQEGRGTHFDPDILDAFLEISEEFRQIALDFCDDEEQRKLLVAQAPETTLFS